MFFFASQQNSATFIVIVTSGNGHLEKKESVKINFKNNKNFDSLLFKKICQTNYKQESLSWKAILMIGLDNRSLSPYRETKEGNR